ncbi:CvpA family protein [Bariatricus sp. SGI.161]|uniref:CvpA family protein n=1 Tax=Lachnospiraceae TaxID=186803 RepID=UPI002A8E71AF|nr:CvpA family protein [Lachnospiraceae bacterium]MDY4207238.1 CvpA family protein [Lachnospiraceae bacterium]
MNWLLITVGVIFLVSIIVGICRGAIKIAVSLATTIVTLVLVFFATPYVAKTIEKYTPMDDVIKNQVISIMANAAVSQVSGEEPGGLSEESVRKVLEAAGVGEDLLSQYGITIEDIVNGNISKEDLAQYGISGNVLDGLDSGQQTAEQAIEGAEIPREMQTQAIQQADLPNVFKSLLTVNNNSEIYQQLGVETFAQYVGSYLAKLIINIVAFLITFVLISIILRAIVFALDIVSSLPGVGIVNRLAGGVIGMVGAMVIVWTLYIIITLMYTTTVGKELFQMIQENQFLTMLYEYNPIMKLATIFH